MSDYNSADLVITISTTSLPGTAVGADGVRDVLHTMTFPRDGGKWTCDTHFSATKRLTEGSGHGEFLVLAETQDRVPADGFLLCPDPKEWIRAVVDPEKWVTEGSDYRSSIHASLNKGIPIGLSLVNPILIFKATIVDGHDLGNGSETICTWVPGLKTVSRLPKSLDGWRSEQAAIKPICGITGLDVREQLRNQLIANSVSLESAWKALTEEDKNGKK